MSWEVPLPEPVGTPVLRQRWNHNGLVHWPYPPEQVRPLLPPGLELDVFDGSAWVSLILFQCEGTRLPGLPAVPFLSTFTEINLRTYVTAPGDRPALWFFSLEAPNPALILGARLAGVPYYAARTSVRVDDDVIEYRSRRVVGKAATLEARLRTGPPYRDEELRALDHFVTARWGAYSRVAGSLRYTPVEHPLWPLHHAELLDLDQTLTDAAGLPPPEGPPLVHHATGFQATLGAPRRVGRPRT